MAQLAAASDGRTGSGLSLAQFRAIAWLRWRILANSFRRKGGAGELVGRILVLPIALAITLLPSAMAGFVAWGVMAKDKPEYLSLVFWGAFGLAQLFNLNLGQPGTTFDPTELIRFPMAVRTYVCVRLCFGLLSPANIIVTLMSVAIFAGVTVARPALWPYTLVATAAFAVANVLFSRMIFAWIDRWLSTRRAREVFTGFIFVGSLAFQYINVNYNPGFNRGRSRNLTAQKIHFAQGLLHHLHPWLRWLPPELSGASILAAEHGQGAASLLNAAIVFAFAALFLVVYGLRMRTEYRGENLSDAANAVGPVLKRLPAAPSPPPLALTGQPAIRTDARRWAAPASLAPMLAKELLYLRRNTGLLYGVVAPTVMVFLFAGRLSLRGGSHWLLLLAVGYALLGLAPMSYNSFGLEGPGAQFYFMAPVPLRDVFLAKNMIQFLLTLFEVCAVIAIVSYVTGPPKALDVTFVVLWATATMLLNTTLGNLRSIAAPKKVNPGRSINRAQSQLSAWIAIGMLAGCAGIGAGLQYLAAYLHLRFVGLSLVALFAAGAFFAYSQGLRGIDLYAMDRRDTLFEELGKKT